SPRFPYTTLFRSVAGEHRGHWQVAAGERLGQDEEVRGDAGLLTGEHRSGAAEADGDLVVDQMHAMAVTGFAQQRQVHRVVHAHAAGPLDQRLDDHGRHFVGVLGQRLFHVREHGPRVRFPAHALGAQVTVGAGHLDGVEQERLVGIGEQGHVAYRHGRHGFAVVAVGERHEALLLRLAAVDPVVMAHLQRHLDAGGTVVGVEHLVQTVRGDLHQTLGQLDHRLMGAAGQHHVLQAVELLADALIDPWVAVGEYIDPPGADRIEIAFALEIFLPDAVAALDRDQRQAFVILHLGTGVPQHGEIALHPLVVPVHGFPPRCKSPSLPEGSDGYVWFAV